MHSVATVTPAYGFREVGGWGIRGWRCHCAHCGHLGTLRLDVRSAQRERSSHQCVTQVSYGPPPTVIFRQ